MKWVPHPWGKCACILTRSLEVTECGKRSLFTNQTNYEKFKNLEHEFLKFSIHRDRKLIPEVVIVDAVKFNSTSKVLWVLKLNQKSDARKLETNSEAANLGKWSLPVHQPATYVNAEKLRKELMSSFKVALKDVVSKLHWKFQITVLEICAQWSSIQRFRAALKQRSVRNIWS